MKLTEIVSDKWIICEITETGQTMMDFYSKNKGRVEKLFALMEDVASKNNGPIKYNSKFIHEIDKNQNLYQFIKGDLRVPFYKMNCDS